MEKSEKTTSNPKCDILKDPRFAHLVNDPRFKSLPKYERKVKIDKRFESMFNDSKFKIKYTVDKYGRRVNQTSSEDLKKYYQLESSTDEEAEEEERREEEKRMSKVDSDDDDDEADLDNIVHQKNDELSNEGVALPSDIKKKLVDSEFDYARGEGRLLSESSSDDESSSDSDDEIFIEHVWGELDQDAPKTDDSTSRLAVCNMDWDRIKSSDIMVLCNSFLPPGGSILNVKIYPSEFGKQRMQEEEVHGPPELTKSNENVIKENDSDLEEDLMAKEQDSDAEEGDEYHMEKLRQYQLNRLKYYYAVIECDSVATADKLYKECDGLEYESTATKLDLRFIPDEVTFDEDEPRDICTELPDLSKYKPRLFTTTALQQAKVELTWDETNLERKEIGEKLSSGKMNEISMTDLKKYIACSSEDDEEEERENDIKTEENKGTDEDNSTTEESENENSVIQAEVGLNKKKKVKDSISKYKSLLEEINKKEEEQKRNKFEIECSWTINTADNNEDEEKDLKDKKNLTSIEKIIEKRREKNKKRKEERKKKLKGNTAENDIDSSEDDIPDGINLNDPYFAEEFINGDFEPVQKTSKKKSLKDKQKYFNRNDSNNDNEDDKYVKELELLLDDDDENDGKKHFSLKKIQDAETETKSKRKRKKKLKKSKQEIETMKKSEIDDNFEINLNDKRFQAVYTSHLYNIDPSDPHYKKTKNMEQIIKEKLKRKYEQNLNDDNNDDEKNKKFKFVTNEKSTVESNSNDSESRKPKKKIENNILVKSIKRKITGKHI